VVPEDLLELTRALAGGELQPARVSLVEVGARFLEDPAIRDVAKEAVLEAERLLADQAPGLGLDQVLVHKRPQAQVKLGSIVALDQLEEGRSRERPSDDRSRLDDRALRRVEPLEPCRHQGLDSGRHGGLRQSPHR